MFDVLEGCRAKVEAMTHHMKRLQDSIDGFFEEEFEVAPVIGEPNSQRTQYVFRVEEVIDYPRREWGVILGEAVHDIRSALDHLVWGFAKDRSTRTGFPIFDTRKDWVVRGPGMYWSVSDGLAKILDAVQPYHRGDVDEARKHPLWILNALSNLDKHRAIPAIALVADSGEAEIIGYGGIASLPSIHFIGGARFEKDEVVAKARIKPDASGVQPYIEAKFKMTFDVGFGQIPAAPSISFQPVEEVMYDVFEYAVEFLNKMVEVWNQAVIAVEDRGDEAEGNASHDDSPS
jgi:hypothetical protein